MAKQKGITVQELNYEHPIRKERFYSDDEILELFPDDDVSMVNPLLRRAQSAEVEVERLRVLYYQARKMQCGWEIGDRFNYEDQPGTECTEFIHQFDAETKQRLKAAEASEITKEGLWEAMDEAAELVALDEAAEAKEE